MLAPLLALLAGPALAQPQGRCWPDHVLETSGMYLTLGVGPEYEVYPGPGRRTATKWLPSDRVTVCQDGTQFTITNVTRGGSLRAFRLLP